MPDSAIDLLAISRGTVTAPAGCGKTHLLAEALKRHGASKPILVLTRTNAGVAALRGRLDKAGVPPGAYRLATIDGWAMRLTGMFPVRSGIDPAILKLANPRQDYPAIRDAAWQLLKGWPCSGSSRGEFRPPGCRRISGLFDSAARHRLLRGGGVPSLCAG